MALEPNFGFIYGPFGIGKTTDLAYSFPTGLFVADPGALKPARHLVGIEPRVAQAANLNDVVAILRNPKQLADSPAVILDDFSLLLDRHIRTVGTGKYWDGVYRPLFEVKEAARKAGVHVIINCPEQAPGYQKIDGQVTNKILYRGGPAGPGEAISNICRAADFIYRGALEKARWPWPLVYHTQGVDTLYDQKSRIPAPAVAPGNLRCIFEAAGYPLTTPFEDYGRARYSLTTKLAEIEGLDKIKAAVQGWKKEAGNLTEHQQLWVIRDALDLDTLQRHQKVGLLSSLGI